ncbi:MAG: glycoside hydrolase family 3 N-terminal domain-containing protein [Rikenellaceae bacterium]
MRKILIFALCCMSIFNLYAEEENLTIAKKAAKMLIVGVKGTTLSPTNKLVTNIKERGVSGVIFFEHNITPISQKKDSRAIFKKLITDVQALTTEKLFLTIDQEGGKVNRLKTKYGFAEMVSQKEVGTNSDKNFAIQMSTTIAREVKSMGLNVNFAPSVDVDINPLCPVIGRVERSFSDDENKVTDMARIYIDSHHKVGVLTSLKHFPGHGSSEVDSHVGFTDISDSWQERELVPFKTLISEKRCDMVMVSHLYNNKIDREHPASLSNPTLDSLLRKTMHWNGVVITDDMQMKAITDNYGFEEAIILGINAGIDLFIISSSASGDDTDVAMRAIQAIVDAVKSGTITEQRLDQSVKRIEDLRKKLQ